MRGESPVLTPTGSPRERRGCGAAGRRGGAARELRGEIGEVAGGRGRSRLLGEGAQRGGGGLEGESLRDVGPAGGVEAERYVDVEEQHDGEGDRGEGCVEEEHGRDRERRACLVARAK